MIKREMFFIDPWEKFAANTAVHREIRGITRYVSKIQKNIAAGGNLQVLTPFAPNRPP